jgi:hypothetical protein
MKNTTIVLMWMVLMMASCSKEESLETGGSGGGGGGSTSGALLVKVQTTGASNSTQDFTYDSKKQLVKYVSTAAAGGTNSSTTFTITRDANGRVSKVVQDIPASMGSPAASAPTQFFYVGPTDTKLKYGIGIIEAPGTGFAIRDSIVYTYTGSSLTKATHFYSLDDGDSYEEFYFSTFSYDARGNVIEQKLLQDMGSGFEVLQVVTSEYDTKPSPLNLNDDALTELGPGAFLATNNATKQTIRVELANTTITSVVSYQYRSDGKPSKATGSLNGAPVQAVFTYQ